MYLIIIQLFKSEFREDLFLALSSAGVTMTTYCEGTSLDNELRNRLPLFSGLFKSPEETGSYATVYFCTAESIEQADAVVAGFEIAGLDWQAEEIFQMVVVPVAKVYSPKS